MNLAHKPMIMTMTWEELNEAIVSVINERVRLLLEHGASSDDWIDRRLDALARREASLRSARAKMAIETGRIAPMSERVARIAERNRMRLEVVA